jgi:MYXO-CTERM domain-containing protein
MLRSAMILLVAVAILPLFSSPSSAQVFRDDFDVTHDYVPGGVGTVPAGGIWTGIHNAINGGSGGLAGIIVANGEDAFDNPKPGVLFIEDLNGGPTGAGVGWEGARNTAPFIFRAIDSSLSWDAKVKINAQTSGFWSAAGIVARRAGPPVGVSPLDATENFVTAFSFRTDEANVDAGTMLTKRIQNGAQVLDAGTPWGGGPGADPEPLPIYARMIKVGDNFTTMSSLDGVNWFTETVVAAPEVSAAGGMIEVGPTYQRFGGGAGEAEFDWFEISIGVVPPTDFTWALAGAGNWNNNTNWSTNTAPGIPNQNDAVVRFGASITAPSTVYADANVTARQLVFNNANNKYVVAGAGILNLDANAGNSQISVTAGSHEIQMAINVADPLTINASANARIDINNRVNLNGNALTITGAGTVSINNNLDSGTAGAVANTSRLLGSGTINGSLTNNSGGVVSPGNSPGTMSVDGTFSQAEGATLLIELGGTGAGAFDKLNVGGALTAGGTLDVDLINGFTPAAGNAFDILDFASATGTFTLSLPALTGGLSWDTTALLTTGLLSVSGGAAGDADFNNDGRVDGNDFLAWQRNLGATGATNSQGDANGDGAVDAADLGVWRSSFGSGAAAVNAATVPEPTALALAAPLLLLAAARRRRRHS